MDTLYCGTIFQSLKVVGAIPRTTKHKGPLYSHNTAIVAYTSSKLQHNYVFSSLGLRIHIYLIYICVCIILYTRRYTCMIVAQVAAEHLGDAGEDGGSGRQRPDVGGGAPEGDPGAHRPAVCECWSGMCVYSLIYPYVYIAYDMYTYCI